MTEPEDPQQEREEQRELEREQDEPLKDRAWEQDDAGLPGDPDVGWED